MKFESDKPIFCKKLSIFQSRGDPTVLFGIIVEEDSKKLVLMTGNGNHHPVLKEKQPYTLTDTNKVFKRIEKSIEDLHDE